jgi:hypothetical protein
MFLSQILYLFYLGGLYEHVGFSLFAVISIIELWNEACEDRNVINKRIKSLACCGYKYRLFTKEWCGFKS